MINIIYIYKAIMMSNKIHHAFIQNDTTQDLSNCIILKKKSQ